MTIFEDSLYKSSNYMLRSLPTDSGIDVTIVDVNHKTVVEQGFYDLKENPKLRDILEYLAPEFVINDFDKTTTDVSNDQASWDSLDGIKNHVHNTVEISDIYDMENEFNCDGQPLFADYKIYDPATVKSPDPCLIASGSMMIDENEKIYNKIANMDKEDAKNEISEYILFNKAQELLKKPNVLETGTLMQNLVRDINNDDSNMFFFDGLEGISKDDYAKFQDDVKKYGLESIVEGIEMDYDDVSEDNCITVYGAMKTVFNDKELFFKDECQEKKLSLDSLKREPVTQKAMGESTPKKENERF